MLQRAAVLILALVAILPAFGYLVGRNTVQKQSLKVQLRKPRKAVLRMSSEDNEVFGAEFKPTKTEEDIYGQRSWKGKSYTQLNPLRKEAVDRDEVMQGYDQIRGSFLKDNVFVVVAGLAAVWYFGTFRDVKSYGLGSALGLMYALLLSRYVEGLGSESGTGGGSARFAPVIILIVAYGKFKTDLSILPELLGFFSYQVASLLQAFNQDAYGEKKSKQ